MTPDEALAKVQAASGWFADEGEIDRSIALLALRAPFPAEALSIKPQQMRRDDKSEKVWCDECKTKIVVDHIHLNYVGHAPLTDRLLTVDPSWNWEPYAGIYDAGEALTGARNGVQTLLWIKLTVVGVTRIGVGSVAAGDYDGEKILIGDALRNAGMRFGMALELWAKDDLESQIGTEVASRKVKPPRTRGNVRSGGSASQGEQRNDVNTGVTARERNKIILALKDLDPPVLEESAVLAHLNALLGRDEPLTKLAELVPLERDLLFKELGITA